MNIIQKLFISVIVFICIPALANAADTQTLDTLEKSFDGKIGVYAIDTNNNQIIDHRGNERFPIQSTFKFIGAAALLKASADHKVSLNKKIHYTTNDLSTWQPITRLHLNDGLTYAALAEATVSYSDTPAMNIITKHMGGPQFVSDFAHSIGNASFNITHYEGELNSDPNNTDDTSTPKDMAMSVKKIILGNVLPEKLKTKLTQWMQNNTVGYRRIRAGTPNGWLVADKTGSGDYGVANDVGILSMPGCKPIILSIYTIQNKADAQRREDILASATQIVLDDFIKDDACLQQT